VNGISRSILQKMADSVLPIPGVMNYSVPSMKIINAILCMQT